MKFALRTRYLVLSSLIAAFAVLAFACADDDSTSTPRATSTATTPATTTTTGTATPATTPTQNGDNGDNGEGGDLTIDMFDNYFAGADGQGATGQEYVVQAPAGEIELSGANKGTAIHNIHFSGGVEAATDLVTAGAEYELDLGEVAAGEYNFICDFHPVDMKGRLVVQ